LEEAGGVFFGEPPGLLHAGHIRAEPGGNLGLHHPADQPRDFHWHALPDVYERRHTREISEYGGLLRIMPIFTVIFGIAALSSMGMPPLNGFIGEITILSGAYQASIYWAFWGAVGIALGAAYLLWLFQRTMLGEVKEKNKGLKDLSWREIAVFAPLVAWAFWIGLNPQPYFKVLERPVAQIVERVHPGYYADRHLADPLALK
jgi:NADH-quinone oxidoreductase subunit M